jgi:hypothetical protein
MFIRHVRAQSPDSQSSMEQNFNAESGASDGQQQHPQDRSYNEVRKLQRLLEKQNKEMEAMRNEFAPLKQRFSQMQGLFGVGNSDDDEEQPMSYLDKVKKADRYLREQDPDSNGLALTLEGAQLIEQLKEQNAKLLEKVEHMSNPQFTAEQNLFVTLEGGIKEEMARFFGEEGVEDNYPDFERVAISKLKEIRQDPKRWMTMLRSPDMQRQFVRAVITAKMPKLDNMPGWKKVETYSVDDAKRDLSRSEALAKQAKEKKSRDLMIQASELAKKARQRLLPETLGLRFNDQD